MASNALYETVGRVKNSLSDMRKKPQNALLDTVRGGLLGATTDTIGYIPDAVADFMRPFGYNVPREDVVGGTEWLANRVSQPTNSLAENAARFTTGMLTPSPADFARLGKGMKSDMTVYHGSPHDFDAFDSSKIGTGEGAQAYGHGLYVAESPGVAKSYQSLGDLTVDNIPAKQGLQKSAAFVVAKEGGVDNALAYAKTNNWTPEAVAEIESLRGKRVRKGSLYTVDLPDSHIANMLDWDAPLSQQPESIRKAIAARVAGVDPDGLDLGGGRVLRNGTIEGGRRFPDKPYPWVLQAGDSVFGLSENDVRRMVGESVETLTGEQAYARLSANMGNQAKASEFLKSLGVPGIRYFDGASRTAKDGSRNYVVFDDKLLKILNKE